MGSIVALLLLVVDGSIAALAWLLMAITAAAVAAVLALEGTVAAGAVLLTEVNLPALLATTLLFGRNGPTTLTAWPRLRPRRRCCTHW